MDCMGSIKFWELFKVMIARDFLIQAAWLRASSHRLRARASLLLSVFRDVHDLVLEDKQVGAILAGKTDHVLVVVLNPSAHHFAVGQFQAHGFLLFPERLEVGGFLESFVRGRSALLTKTWISRLERHKSILHGGGSPEA